MRANRPGAGWSWLLRGIHAGRRNPGALFGAAGWLVLCAVLPSAVQLAVQSLLHPGTRAVLAVGVVATLASAVLYPLLFGGFMQLIDASEHGRPVRAAALFATFREGGGRGRLVGLGLALLLVYVAFLALLLLTVGREVLAWYAQVLSQSAPAAAATRLPGGLGTTVGLFAAFGILYGGAYAIGVGEVALRGRPPLAALRDGFAGALRNVLPLLVLSVCGVVALLVASLLVALLAGTVAALAGLVGETLAFIVLVPLYFALMAAAYVVTLGVMYAVWRDVAGADPGDIAHRLEA